MPNIIGKPIRNKISNRIRDQFCLRQSAKASKSMRMTMAALNQTGPGTGKMTELMMPNARDVR